MTAGEPAVAPDHAHCAAAEAHDVAAFRQLGEPFAGQRLAADRMLGCATW